MALVIKLSMLVSVFVLSILFWWDGIIICAVLTCIFIAVEANVKSIAYVLFLTSFENHLRSWFLYITTTVILVCAIQYLVKKPWAEKKKFLVLAVGICVYLLYAFIISISTISGTYFMLLRHLLLLFFLCNLRDDLDFRMLVYVFVGGVLVACSIGLFVGVIPELACRTIEYREFGLTRFDALTGNPNRLHPHIFAAINGLFILDLRRQISKKKLILLFAVLFGLGLSTMARTFCLVIAINLVAYAGIKLLREKKVAFKQIAIIGIAALAVCSVMYKHTAAVLMRFGVIDEHELVHRQNPPRQDQETGLLPGYDDLWNNSVVDDPGRYGIWKVNIAKWLSSPKTFLFGYGYGSSNFGKPHQHSLYVFLLVKTGVVGVLLFILFWFALFYNMYKLKKYKFDLATLLFLVIFAVHAILELRFPAITGFIFIFMFIFALEKKKEPNQNSKTSI